MAREATSRRKKPRPAARRKPSHPVDPAVINRERGAFEGSTVTQHTASESLIGSTAQPRSPPVFDDADAYTVSEFCIRHRLSVALFYKLPDQMPATFKIGKRRLISREAAARWRAAREAANAAEAV